MTGNEALKQQLMRILELGERGFQWMQGKGYGAATMRKEVAAALPFLPFTGAVICDIGANHGNWIREMLRQASPRIAKIYAFEPSEHNHQFITAIGDPRIRLVAKAVSDFSGDAVLHYDKPSSGLASLTQRRLDHYGIVMSQEERVSVARLDDFMTERSLDRIDFVKIDIEGHELAALKGAQKALSSKAIGAIAFEFGGTSIDTRTYFQDFWYLLTSHGYKIARINPFFRPVLVSRYSESFETFRVTNFLAYPG